MKKNRLTLTVPVTLTFLLMLGGCSSSTPTPTKEGEKSFVGRAPTSEELAAAKESEQAEVKDRMKDVKTGP